MIELVKEILEVLLETHGRELSKLICRDLHILQKAQPITLAHHMGAYFEMFKRDRCRLNDIYEENELLSAGMQEHLQEQLIRWISEYTAELLGFARTDTEQYGFCI